MKNNIICIDLTKFNNEKLKEVSNELNLSYDIVLKNKKKGFAKIFLDGSRVIAFTTKKDKGTINFMDSFANDLMKMDSFEVTDEPVNFELDSVLEKITKYGVDSLSKNEKKFLDNLSK
jgi:hypothetical protein